MESGEARRQFPQCLPPGSKCDCFDDLENFDANYDYHTNTVNRNQEYILKIKEQLEYFLYLIEVHDNKDHVIISPQVSQIRVSILRTMLRHLQSTRYLLEKEEKLCEFTGVLEMASKDILLTTYIKCIEEGTAYRMKALEVFYNYDDYVPLFYLKNLLTNYMDLIYTFEQFEQLVFSGYCCKIVSKSGKINNVVIKKFV